MDIPSAASEALEVPGSAKEERAICICVLPPSFPAGVCAHVAPIAAPCVVTTDAHRLPAAQPLYMC